MRQHYNDKKGEKMKRVLLFGFVLLACLCGVTSISSADPAAGEKECLTELKKAVPADRIVSIDDLYKKWQEVQAGKSNAIIIDVRTEAEFDAAHILNSNNVDSGNVYTMPKKWPDVETEIWVLCRTQHRASYFTSLLYKYGYKNVYLTDGGIVAWAEKGYPLYSRYLGEIKIAKYDKDLKENYIYRENK
jgi:rhodanese-related sulfurtransferase